MLWQVEVVELAALYGARALGMEDEIATMEPGKRADLIGIDFSSSPHGIPMYSEGSQIVYRASTRMSNWRSLTGKL